tara:strand:- start:1654 stop:3798 length:2145 start_codon:yes stop_codon:yes gene_type:complete
MRKIALICFLSSYIFAQEYTSSFTSTLIDSSKNGYGSLGIYVSPLSYSEDENLWLAVYRQWQGANASSGYIGSAQISHDDLLDGEPWFTEQKLNECYPGGTLCDGDLPTASTESTGRYPSAAFAGSDRPIALWNEYTDPTYGGGNYGGYPVYSSDTDIDAEFSDWVTPFSVNNGCASLPCDPADLWNGNVLINNGAAGGPKFSGIYAGWGSSPAGKHYLVTSSFYANGYFLMNDPVEVADDLLTVDGINTLWMGENYATTPVHSINQDGVGYFVQTGYHNDSVLVESPQTTGQCMLIKKTTDYGDNWTNDEGFMNTGYTFLTDQAKQRLSDSLFTLWTEEENEYVYHYGDTIQFTGDTLENGDPFYHYVTPGMWFAGYNFGMVTDNSGGLHVLLHNIVFICKDLGGGCDDADGDGEADSTFLWFGANSGSGIYHLYSPDPTEGVDNWEATLVHDLSFEYTSDWYNGEIFASHDGVDDWYYTMWSLVPRIAVSSEEGSEVMWYALSAVSDYEYDVDLGTGTDSAEVVTDLDLFVAKSIDNGRSWTEPEQITETLGPEGARTPEIHVHLSNQSTDDFVGVYYNIPDYAYGSTTGDLQWADYKQWIYAGVYMNDLGSDQTVSVDNNVSAPTKFSLSKNYPNPFNPVTNIDYEISKSAHIALDLYDITGKHVKTLINEQKPAGSHQFVLDAERLSSGVYFYTMVANGITKTEKFVLMK